VLITGGTGGLGVLLARHLAAERGVRHMLLVSRRGPEAEGANELCVSLRELGCKAQIVACDVTDRQALSKLLENIDSKHPLTAIIHAAGVRDDGLITSLDRERLEGVLAPKVDAAIHLHELTEHLELSDFVLFSSIAATLGSPGQASYAAANSFLDALAAHRRARGMPATALAFGLWATPTGMTGGLSEADRGRLEQLGMFPLSTEEGLEAIDLVRDIDESLLFPVRLNLGVLRANARIGVLPAVMRDLAGSVARRAAPPAGSLVRVLANVPDTEWDAVTLELVLGRVATVLGYSAGEMIDADRSFKELGFDSLGAVELRNRLSQATGLRLSSTLIFDFPTPAAVAKYLRLQVADIRTTRPAIDQELDRLDAMLASIATENSERERIGARLRVLMVRLAGDGRANDNTDASERIQSATADEIYHLLDERLGKS
jgi:pimaricinolide synthase PimS1